MAKKTKDTSATAKKNAKTGVVDPVKTRNLVRLLNILSLLLAITAFLLQFFAVVTHHWKRQVTDLQPIVTPSYHYAERNIHDDSRLDQRYGLFSRDVKLYANNDEALDVWASTRFPRPDEGDTPLHTCLGQTSTLRGAFLTCSDRVISPENCHCRRYTYWNWFIVFEILALIFLGIVVLVCALLTTQYHGLLKPVGVALSFLAFLFLLIGLILLTTNLRREVRSLADAYPHVRQRLVQKLGRVDDHNNRAIQQNPTQLRRAVRRQTHETYRSYPLSPGQYAFNATHFQEYSTELRDWVYVPYSSLPQQPVLYAPRAQESRATYPPSNQRNATTLAYNQYGPVLGYDRAIENTRAWISWSTILSILAMLLSLLLPLILAFSWLTGKKLGPDVKTVTTTTVKTEYVPVPHEVSVETVPLQQRQIHSDYDHHRNVGDAVVTTHNVPYGRPEPVIVRDVVIRDDHPVQSGYSRSQQQQQQQHTFPVNVETSANTQRQ